MAVFVWVDGTARCTKLTEEPGFRRKCSYVSSRLAIRKAEEKNFIRAEERVLSVYIKKKLKIHFISGVRMRLLDNFRQFHFTRNIGVSRGLIMYRKALWYPTPWKKQRSRRVSCFSSFGSVLYSLFACSKNTEGVKFVSGLPR